MLGRSERESPAHAALAAELGGWSGLVEPGAPGAVPGPPLELLDLGTALRRPRDDADALEPFGHQPGHADEELGPPPAADHTEPDGSVLRHRTPSSLSVVRTDRA